MNMPELEKICSNCAGKAVVYNTEEDCFSDCPSCHGSGFTPTAIGERILELVRHNSRVDVTAELRVSGASS
jgi:hypothetical protein